MVLGRMAMLTERGEPEVRLRLLLQQVAVVPLVIHMATEHSAGRRAVAVVLVEALVYAEPAVACPVRTQVVVGGLGLVPVPHRAAEEVLAARRPVVLVGLGFYLGV